MIAQVENVLRDMTLLVVIVDGISIIKCICSYSCCYADMHDMQPSKGDLRKYLHNILIGFVI